MHCNFFKSKSIGSLLLLYSSEAVTSQKTRLATWVQLVLLIRSWSTVMRIILCAVRKLAKAAKEMGDFLN